jgi:hypothetical protein
MMDAIYTLLMQMIHDRFHRPQRTKTIADVPLAKFNERMKSSRRYRVFELGSGIYQVQVPDYGQKYVVNLKECTCDCQNFQEYLAPCAHAIIACKYAAEDPFNYICQKYTVNMYWKTYSHFLKPLSIENLPSDLSITFPFYLY